MGSNHSGCLLACFAVAPLAVAAAVAAAVTTLAGGRADHCKCAFAALKLAMLINAKAVWPTWNTKFQLPLLLLW